MGTIISVTKVQQGLAQAHDEGMAIPSPGRIDGDWGPLTERSLDAYLTIAGFHGEVAVMPESGQLEIGGSADSSANAAAIVAGLDERARVYARIEQGIRSELPELEPASTVTPSGSALTRRARPEAAGPLVIDTDRASRMRWGLWLAVLLGLGVIGGAVWWVRAKR